MAAFFATALLSIMALGQTTIAQWSFEGVTTAKQELLLAFWRFYISRCRVSILEDLLLLDITQILQLFGQIH